MSATTGLCVTAGVLVLGADILGDKFVVKDAIVTSVGVTLAAFVSAGLDVAVPGLGTGFAVLLVVAAAYRSLPTISDRLFQGK